MTVDIRKTLTDAGYIAVGVGVLGVQQAQTRRRELQDALAAASPLHVIGDQTNDARLKVKAGLDRATEAAQGFTETVREAAKPIVVSASERATTLPQPIPNIVEPAINFAKTLVGV